MNTQMPEKYAPQRADLYDMLICIGTVVASFSGLLYLADRSDLIAPILTLLFGY